ncbi:PDDEXK nuclease domain-containing protein [Thalassolituus sp. UBA2590]|uniref:PDDEXK nuclease domain-containing protein n=1 Tax=Thalassolituus sp. UBA2590 TaxID=1947663 RepID=UPI00264A06BF|nr:PDDEXK nuclease domain-containing protein [Thalassolituus sp. UBA2590]
MSQKDTPESSVNVAATGQSDGPLTGFDGLIGLLEQTHAVALRQASRATHSALVVRNWLYGWYICEYEVHSRSRSEVYGKQLMETLSKRLTARLGKGFSRRTLDQFRQFYQHSPKIGQTLFAQSSGDLKQAVQQLLATPPTHDEIQQTLSAESSRQADKVNQTTQKGLSESDLMRITQALMSQFPLSWSHYLFLLSIADPDERQFYEVECGNEGWSLRELKRQFDASLYERLALSRDKAGVKKLAEQGAMVDKPSDVIKDPLVLEFLGFEAHHRYSETELETAIIDKLEHFLLELGKGFLFEARQKRFTFDEDHFYVDLVFYNRLLRCYVLIDLKIGELKHQDLGQMQMYVNYFDRYVKLDDEQPTIGIVLCKKKKDALVEITLPEGANIHAAKYQTYLPDKNALKQQLQEAQAEWEAIHESVSATQDKDNQ